MKGCTDLADLSILNNFDSTSLAAFAGHGLNLQWPLKKLLGLCKPLVNSEQFLDLFGK